MARDEEAHRMSVESLRLIVEAEHLLGALEAHTNELQQFVKAARRDNDQEDADAHDAQESDAAPPDPDGQP